MLSLALAASLLASVGASPSYDEGVALYRKGSFKAAVAALTPHATSSSATVEARTSARAYLAASHFAQKDERAAQGVLEALFVEAPGATLDEGVFPPAFIAFAQRIRPAPVRPAVELGEAPRPVATPPDPVAPASSPASGPAPAAKKTGPVKLASFGVSFVDLSEKKGEFFLDGFHQELIRRGFQVVSKSDVATLLGFERQKALLGCDTETSSCLSELGNALGVDGVVTGNLARLDGRYVVRLKVMAANSTQALALHSSEAANDAEMLETMNEAAADVAAQTARALGRETKASSTAAAVDADAPPGGGLKKHAWKISVAGGLLLGAGGVLRGMATNERDSLLAQPDLDSFNAARSRTETLQNASVAAMVAGFAAVAVAGGIYIFGSDEPAASAGVMITPEGAVMGVGGVF